MRLGCYLLVLSMLGLGCGPKAGSSGRNDAGGGNGDGGAGLDGFVSLDGGGGSDGGSVCEPPDMLIVLDRTMSMHRRPDGSRPPDTQQGHEESKWYLAVTAIEQVTANLDQRVRFGLELFPRDPGGGACVTLTQRINDITATNTQCEEGEVPVFPDVGTSGAIAGAIDPETTLLCRSTPIGGGLQTALDNLQLIQDPIREQYVLLVTDGQDTCNNPDPAQITCDLANAGIASYVVGFDASGTGVDPAALNNMACAGLTAPDHAQSCQDNGGCFAAVAPTGPTLYLTASNGTELQTRIDETAASIGCLVQ